MSDRYTSTFEIKHFDHFTYGNSKPNQKEWNFELTINEFEPNLYRACFSKEPVKCLYQMNDLRNRDIALNTDGICFTYTLDADNSVIIKDKQKVFSYFNDLKKFLSSNLLLGDAHRFVETIDYYLEYEEALDRELSRELNLIHEYDGEHIPIGVSGVVEDEAINFEKLKSDEIDFLNRIDWKSLNRIDLIRTPEINDNDFLLDYIFGLDVVSSDEHANLEEISQLFFEGSLEVNDHDNVTLNRDQRHLDKINNRLTYLLKQRRTSSSNMMKITRLEIIKK